MVIEAKVLGFAAQESSMGDATVRNAADNRTEMIEAGIAAGSAEEERNATSPDPSQPGFPL